MGQFLEIEISNDLAETWPTFLEGQGFEVRRGPSLQELHDEAMRNRPTLGLPAPSQSECECFYCVDCVDGPVVVRVTGELVNETGKYIIDVRSERETWKTRKRARTLEKQIVSLLCANGGRMYNPREDY